MMKTALRLPVSCLDMSGLDINAGEEAIIPTTEDLSELPDAPPLDYGEALDFVASLPADPPKSPYKARCIRRPKAKSVSRSRRSSRAPSAPTGGVTSVTPEKLGDLEFLDPATVPRAASHGLGTNAGFHSDPVVAEE